MKTAMQELIYDLSQIFHENQISLKIDMSKYLEKEKEQSKISIVEIKQIISSITNTKLTISEKHDLAVAIYEKIGGEVKSYINTETENQIIDNITKNWNSENQNK
jgi:hypothetical protein